MHGYRLVRGKVIEVVLSRGLIRVDIKGHDPNIHKVVTINLRLRRGTLWLQPYAPYRRFDERDIFDFVKEDSMNFPAGFHFMLLLTCHLPLVRQSNHVLRSLTSLLSSPSCSFLPIVRSAIRPLSTRDGTLHIPSLSLEKEDRNSDQTPLRHIRGMYPAP